MIENTKLNIYLKAFKAYDIRGIYGEEINDEFAYILGRAIGKYFKKKYGLNGKFLIAKDVRPHNNELIKQFMFGFLEVGKDEKNGECLSFKNNILFANICSTSITYYIGQGEFNLSVNFTASHNPPEFVGMKFFDKNTTFLSQDLLKNIFTEEFNYILKNKIDFIDIKQKKDWREYIYFLSENNIFENQEKTSKKDFLEKKISQLFSFLNTKYKKLTKKHKFVVDFSNGSATKYEKRFLKELKEQGHNIFFLNEKADGTFPNHLSDTQEYENYKQCIKKVKKENAEFGIMFDGDADRIGFVSKDGNVIGGDILLTILAKQILKTNKSLGNTIIYEVMCSKIIKEEIEKLGGKTILHKMGRFFIKEKMDKENAILGGETSGHFMFKEIGGYEMPLLALFYIIKESENRKSFKEMVGNYKKYHKTAVLSKKVKNKYEIIEKIKKKYSDLNQETIDGISIFGDKFWFNVRCSNTENKIRYTVEADTKEKLEQELKKLEKILN